MSNEECKTLYTKGIIYPLYSQTNESPNTFQNNFSTIFRLITTDPCYFNSLRMLICSYWLNIVSQTKTNGYRKNVVLRTKIRMIVQGIHWRLRRFYFISWEFVDVSGNHLFYVQWEFHAILNKCIPIPWEKKSITNWKVVHFFPIIVG